MTTDTRTIPLDERLAPRDLSTEGTVGGWFRALRERGVAFHPEHSFREATDRRSGRRAFSDADADRLDKLMDRAYAVCDPCGVALRIVCEQDATAAPAVAPARPESRSVEPGVAGSRVQGRLSPDVSVAVTISLAEALIQRAGLERMEAGEGCWLAPDGRQTSAVAEALIWALVEIATED